MLERDREKKKREEEEKSQNKSPFFSSPCSRSKHTYLNSTPLLLLLLSETSYRDDYKREGREGGLSGRKRKRA
jgi:hypothetical protein